MNIVKLFLAFEWAKKLYEAGIRSNNVYSWYSAEEEGEGELLLCHQFENRECCFGETGIILNDSDYNYVCQNKPSAPSFEELVAMLPVRINYMNKKCFLTIAPETLSDGTVEYSVAYMSIYLKEAFLEIERVDKDPKIACTQMLLKLKELNLLQNK